jgi:hypothetical protein
VHQIALLLVQAPQDPGGASARADAERAANMNAMCSSECCGVRDGNMVVGSWAWQEGEGATELCCLVQSDNEI